MPARRGAPPSASKEREERGRRPPPPPLQPLDALPLQRLAWRSPLPMDQAIPTGAPATTSSLRTRVHHACPTGSTTHTPRSVATTRAARRPPPPPLSTQDFHNYMVVPTNTTCAGPLLHLSACEHTRDCFSSSSSCSSFHSQPPTLPFFCIDRSPHIPTRRAMYSNPLYDREGWSRA